VIREVVGPLRGWDAAGLSEVILESGTLLSGCRIRRLTGAGTEPYVVEFAANGRAYSCPLFQFQPRTRAIDLTLLEGVPACEAVAV
jgi:hypothetical protein